MAGSSVTLCADKLFKVLVIGDPGVGKSSIILRYLNKCFDERYKASIGVDFALKTIEWDAKTVVRLQLWDIAGECQDCEVSVVLVCPTKPKRKNNCHRFYHIKLIMPYKCAIVKTCVKSAVTTKLN